MRVSISIALSLVSSLAAISLAGCKIEVAGGGLGGGARVCADSPSSSAAESAAHAP
jgi:hypothetical protein